MTRLPSNFEFAITLGDEPSLNKVYFSPLPFFSWTQADGHWDIPFPNMMNAQAKTQYRAVPWEDKSDRIYWRGAMSYPTSTLPSTLRTIPRVRLLQLARDHPEVFDVRVTAIDGDRPRLAQRMHELLQRLGTSIAPREDFEHTLPQYKYLLNVDGVVAA